MEDYVTRYTTCLEKHLPLQFDKFELLKSSKKILILHADFELMIDFYQSFGDGKFVSTHNLKKRQWASDDVGVVETTYHRIHTGHISEVDFDVSCIVDELKVLDKWSRTFSKKDFCRC
jgi:hypothetical protein